MSVGVREQIRPRRRRRLLIVAVAAPMILAAASWVAQTDQRDPVLQTSSLHFVQAPGNMQILSLAWDPFQRRLVASAIAGGSGSMPHLFELPDPGHNLQALSTAGNPDCAFTEQLNPQPLRDGRIVYLQLCHAATVQPTRFTSVWVYDQKSRSTKRFRPYWLHLWPTTLAVTTDGTEGLFAGDSLSYAHVYALRAKRLAKLPAPVSFARNIAWSDDASQFAIGAVPSWHPEGWDIFVAHPWRIYVGDRAGARYSELPLHLTGETEVSWSPNGRWLAFVSSPQSQRTGLWVIELSTGNTVFLVADKELKSPTWLPDGRLLALRFASSLGLRNGYYAISRSSLVDHGVDP